MTVLFWMTRDSRDQPMPAVVERISHRGTPETGPILELTVIGRPLTRKPAVRWRGTNAKEYEGYSEGYYDLTDTSWKLQEMIDLSPRLSEMLADYESQVEAEEPVGV